MIDSLFLNTFKIVIIFLREVMNNLKTKLGQKIKYLRKQQNITQEKLAELINMDITSLSKIETGRNYPQPETIEKISKALNVEIGQIFTFQSPETKEDYIKAINRNIQIIENNEEKLRILYNITSFFI